MKLTLPLIAILLAFNWYIVPAQAPVMDMPVFTERDATDARPRVHPVKIYYDRLPEIGGAIEKRMALIEPCAIPGRLRWRGKCWLPDRIPRTLER